MAFCSSCVLWILYHMYGLPTGKAWSSMYLHKSRNLGSCIVSSIMAVLTLPNIVGMNHSAYRRASG